MIKQGSQVQIVILGGGSGTSVLADGLAACLPQARITAVVGVGDSGSKTGELRHFFGGVAVGDLRKVLGAVSGNQLGLIFSYRFGANDSKEKFQSLAHSFVEAAAADGYSRARLQKVMHDTSALAADIPGLQGHTFGNLVLTALRQDYHGTITPAIREAGGWLKARANVLPVTDEAYDVVLFDGARQIVGEGTIDKHRAANPTKARLWLTPFASMSPEVRHAIIHADIVAVAPGSLFTSLLPVLAVRGMPEALHRQRQRGGAFVAIGNLLSETATAPGLDLADYIEKLQRQAERTFDYVLYNETPEDVPTALVALHCDVVRLKQATAKPIGAALVGQPAGRLDPNDPVAAGRTRLYHDPKAVAVAMETHIPEARPRGR